VSHFEISLIITTYNWEEALGRVLKSVESQEVLPKEVIVADDGSREETTALIRKIRETFPIPLIHCWQEDKGFRLAESRNRAIAASTSSYLIMIDGDMVLHPKFISSHKSFAREGCYVTGSRVMLSKSKSERIISSARLPGFFSPGITGRFNTLNFPYLSELCTDFKGTKSCNMAIWRQDAVDINGFNADFTGWGAEDSDFARRLSNNGIRRQKFKFGGVAFHLYHKKNDRAKFQKNREILYQSIYHRSQWCENGLDKFITKQQKNEIGK